MTEYRPRKQAPPFEGVLNLYALPCLPDLFMSLSGRAWSTRRKGLRQRKFFKYNRILVLSVSRKGNVTHFTAGSLVMLALLHDARVHWDGSKIVPGWTNGQNLADAGEGFAVDIAPLN